MVMPAFFLSSLTLSTSFSMILFSYLHTFSRNQLETGKKDEIEIEEKKKLFYYYVTRRSLITSYGSHARCRYMSISFVSKQFQYLSRALNLLDKRKIAKIITSLFVDEEEIESSDTLLHMPRSASQLEISVSRRRGSK